MHWKRKSEIMFVLVHGSLLKTPAPWGQINNNCNGSQIRLPDSTRIGDIQRNSAWQSSRCNMVERTFWHVRPTKTQISLHIRAVCSKSSLSAWENIAPLAIQNAPSKDSSQTARIRRLIWIFAGRICPKLCFLTLPRTCLWYADKCW